MPNWCENEVDIDGTDEHVKEFIAEFFTPVKEDVYFLDFHKVVPLGLPKNDDGTPGWNYDEATNAWGTKWDLDNSEDNWFHQFTSTGDNNQVSYRTLNARFDTAWGPPEGIYDAMTEWIYEKNYDISITWFYKEPGIAISGWLGCD